MRTHEGFGCAGWEGEGLGGESAANRCEPRGKSGSDPAHFQPRLNASKVQLR